MKEMNLNVLTYLSSQSKLNLHRTKTFFLFKSNLNGSININFYYARCRVLFNRKARQARCTGECTMYQRALLNKISLRGDFGFQWKVKDAGYFHHQVYKKKLYFTSYM